MDKGDRLLPVKIVSERLNLSTKTVYRLIGEGYIEAVRTTPKKGLRVFESELRSFVKRNSTLV